MNAACHRFQETPLYTALLQKLTDGQLLIKIPCLMWNLKVHYDVHETVPLVCILIQMNPIHILTSYLLQNSLFYTICHHYLGIMRGIAHHCCYFSDVTAHIEP
jgi:hypothetical protein